MTRIAKLDYPGKDIRMLVSTPIEEQYRVTACTKEPWTVQWIESMPTGSVLYDVGANVGSYSLLAAALGHTVVAIEPSFANYARLCENILLNDLGHNVVPICAALGQNAGARTLVEQHNEPGYSGGAQRLHVLTFTVDALRHFAPHPTHVKIDTDGADAAVLAGCGDAGQSFMVEVTNGQEPAIDKITAQLGLTLKQKWTARAVTPGMPPLNGWWYGLWERG